MSFHLEWENQLKVGTFKLLAHWATLIFRAFNGGARLLCLFHYNKTGKLINLMFQQHVFKKPVLHFENKFLVVSITF